MYLEKIISSPIISDLNQTLKKLKKTIIKYVLLIYWTWVYLGLPELTWNLISSDATNMLFIIGGNDMSAKYLLACF